jgi:D-3-phosphoglycerate dehydrogenase
MTKPLVVLFEEIHEVGWNHLREHCDVRLVLERDPDAIRRALADADGVILRSQVTLTDDLMAAAPKLKVIGRHGVGLEVIDLPAARRRGIVVVYTPEANTEAVAEHAVAMMLALSKRLPESERAVHQGDWSLRDTLSGREMRGRSLGVVGAGRIGYRVAEICHTAFAMPVLYADVVANETAEKKLAARRVGLDELLESCEYVSLHVPLIDETRHLIDARAFERLRPDSILINTCRGSVVDTDALVASLRAGRPAAYGADVFDPEPLPADHPLLELSNTLLTMHTAAHTEEARIAMSRVAEDVVRVLKGEQPVWGVQT